MTGAELYKFMRKHATTPLKIGKPTSVVDDHEPNTIKTTKTPVDSYDAKDEL